MMWKLLGVACVLLAGFVLGTVWPSRPVAEAVDFLGALLGAGAGVGAAFLAVHLQQAAEAKRLARTFNLLIFRLEGSAEILIERSETVGNEALNGVFRAYLALMEAAEMSRGQGAGIATIASRMRHSFVFSRIIELQVEDRVGAKTLENLARAVLRLCRSLRGQMEMN